MFGGYYARLVSQLARWDTLALAGVLATICLISPNFRNPDIDDLDSAHHLMDGYFFRDVMVDHPVAHLPAYTVKYYKQYPALGFLFWPPFFPFVLGLYCLVLGTNVFAARVCIAFFGVIFALTFYAILRRRFPVWLSFCATVAAVVAPGIAWSFNEVMLELPTLGVLCVAVLAYLNVVEHLDQRTSIMRAFLCGMACAAVVYTKQPAWFLYPVLGLDFLVLHRRFFRKAEVVIAVSATFVLCLPLALFTLKFGRANLAQSLGTNSRIMLVLHNSSVPRWSYSAWTFYPKLAPSLVGLMVLILALGAIVLAAFNRTVFQQNVLWIGWFVFAYVTYSYYDNRQPRYATFWCLAWVALAAGFLEAVMRVLPRKWAWAFPLLLLFSVPWQIRAAWQTDFTDYREVESPISSLFGKGSPGNVLVFGRDKQVMVALIREYDRGRTVNVIRGDRLIGDARTVADICRIYRIQTVLVEVESNSSGLPSVDSAMFRPVQSSLFQRRGMPVRLLGFRYLGPLSDKKAEVPLSNELF